MIKYRMCQLQQIILSVHNKFTELLTKLTKLRKVSLQLHINTDTFRYTRIQITFTVLDKISKHNF